LKDCYGKEERIFLLLLLLLLFKEAVSLAE